jgi:hypothetical protein
MASRSSALRPRPSFPRPSRLPANKQPDHRSDTSSPTRSTSHRDSVHADRGCDIAPSARSDCPRRKGESDRGPFKLMNRFGLAPWEWRDVEETWRPMSKRSEPRVGRHRKADAGVRLKAEAGARATSCSSGRALGRPMVFGPREAGFSCSFRRLISAPTTPMWCRWAARTPSAAAGSGLSLSPRAPMGARSRR